MPSAVFEKRTPVDASAADLFAWHARPGALPRLTPPWEKVQVVDPGPGIEDGARATIRVRLGPVWRRWIAEHRDVVVGKQFRDVQIEGPFTAWDHLHSFEAQEDGTATLADRIEFRLPLPTGFVRRALARTFGWRHRITAGDLAAKKCYAGVRPMRVLVTGASGLVGRALSAFLSTQGHDVVPLVRGDANGDAPSWDPAAGTIDLSQAGPLDGVVHLAGENVASGRWSEARKARILASRVEGTTLLARALSRLDSPPRVLISASGTGFYGDRGDEVLTEESAHGTGFLADLAQAWEAAAEPAAEAGMRVVSLRLGIVLTPAGGALPKLLGPAKWGLGGPLGKGDQYWPWIAIDDVLDIALRALVDEKLSGPVNTVAPQVVTNRDFARTLGRVLKRPAFAPAPAFALRLLMGEMADEMLLASQRVVPKRLLEAEHAWREPSLEGALRHVLGRRED